MTPDDFINQLSNEIEELTEIELQLELIRERLYSRQCSSYLGADIQTVKDKVEELTEQRLDMMKRYLRLG